MGKWKTIFLGTPDFAVPILRRLAEETDVVLVITQPDRGQGRGRKVAPPPVKVVAEELGIEVLQPDIVKGKRFASRIAAREPDFMITAAFGRILGPSLLEVPTRASLNVHASILPRHRGAAPANWAILSGDTETGVSIMKMEKGLDTGPVYHVEKTPIGEDETAGDLLLRLAQIGAKALLSTLERFDTLSSVEQNHADATWAPTLKKADGRLDWGRSARENHYHIRGMHPWPVATTHIQGNPLRIHRASILAEDTAAASPGKILDLSPQGIDVACGRGVLRLTEIQAAGRKRLPVVDFLKGTKLEPGESFSNN